MPTQESPPQTVRPFSFVEGWETSNHTFPPVDFAEQQVEQCIKFAVLCGAQGQADAAVGMLNKAERWRQIAAQRPDEADPPALSSHLLALESIGVLLTRAKQGSDEAVKFLKELMETIASNLCALVFHEEGDTAAQAAAALVKGLSKAVSDFETLAKSKPNALLPETRSALGMPGFISPAAEKVKDNVALVTQLEVGAESLFYLPTTAKGGKTMKLVTGPNLWAARLVGYILVIRAELERRSHLRAAHEKGSELGNDCINDFFRDLQNPAPHPDDYSPEWLQAAVDLEPFSPNSWPSWFEVAWMVVIDVTQAKPERKPALYEIGKSGAKKSVSYRLVALDGTKISNVRGVIRSRLREAFEVLATRDLPRKAKKRSRKV